MPSHSKAQARIQPDWMLLTEFSTFSPATAYKSFRVQKKHFLQWTQLYFAGLPPSQHVTRGSCLLVHSFHQTGIPRKGFSCSPLHRRYQMNTYLLNDNVLCQECPPTCPHKIPYRLKVILTVYRDVPGPHHANRTLTTLLQFFSIYHTPSRKCHVSIKFCMLSTYTVTGT